MVGIIDSGTLGDCSVLVLWALKSTVGCVVAGKVRTDGVPESNAASRLRLALVADIRC
jgi:hypothetical protein